MRNKIYSHSHQCAQMIANMLINPDKIILEEAKTTDVSFHNLKGWKLPITNCTILIDHPSLALVASLSLALSCGNSIYYTHHGQWKSTHEYEELLVKRYSLIDKIKVKAIIRMQIYLE